MAGLSGKDVISFFKNADLELAELVLEFGQAAVGTRLEVRAKQSANLKKARAARKPAGSTTAEVAAPVAEAPVPEPASPIQEARQRRTHAVHVQAPAHTAEATAATSD